MKLQESIYRIKEMMGIINESDKNIDDDVTNTILNGSDWDDFIKALELKYGKTIPLYHATTEETSKVIDKEGFKLTYGKNYISFVNEPIMYFQIGQSDYKSSNRPVVYRMDVPLEFISKYANIDMDNVNITEEELKKVGVDFEYWDDMSSDIRDVISYFVWNGLTLDGMELLISDRDSEEGNIFNGLQPIKLEE
jgi:hypothetical protein